MTTRTLDQREAKSSHFYNSIHNHSKKAVLYKSVHGDDVRLKEKALIFYSHFQPKPKNHGELYFFYKKQNGNKINPAQICWDKNMLKQKTYSLSPSFCFVSILLLCIIQINAYVMRMRINCVEEKRDCHKLRRKILNIEHPKTNINLITIRMKKVTCESTYSLNPFGYWIFCW